MCIKCGGDDTAGSRVGVCYVKVVVFFQAEERLWCYMYVSVCGCVCLCLCGWYLALHT